jgi:DNA repair exonuclease SbcCD ATPase subunit
MFIREIILENFQNLKTGIGVNKLELDFTKQKNPVCIIIGPNGAGKTSLLSYLTPFATVGDLDIRNATRPIIKGKNGYKKIVLLDDERNEYVIEHFYTPKSDGAFIIKSYFKMNDVELNENGNVTSFKDLVAEHLDIEMSYLKLIRMGDNVKNLITSRGAERKVFATKILEEVDWYLKQYKEASQREKDTKAVIGHIIDEIKKTSVEDEKKSEIEIAEMNQELATLDAVIAKVNEELTRYKYDYEKLNIGGDFPFLLKAATKRIESFTNALEIAKAESLDLKKANKKLESLSLLEVELQGKVKAASDVISRILQDIDNEMNELDEIKASIKKEEKDLNLESLENYFHDLRKRTNHAYRSAFDERTVNCSKEEFDEFVVFLKNIQSQLNLTYDFGKDPIKKVLKEMKANNDIPSLIKASLLTIEAQENAERLSLVDRIINRYAGIKITCEQECPLKQLHKELLDIKDAVPVASVKYTSEFYHMMQLAYDNLTNVFSQLNEKAEFIQKLPEDIQKFFLVDNLYKKIGNAECIFDDKLINDYISFLTERENYNQLKKECDEVEKDLIKMKALSKMEFLTKQRDKISSHIEKLQEELEDEKASKEAVEDELRSCRSDITSVRTISEALTEYDEAKTNYEDITKRDEEGKKLSSRIGDLDSQLNEFNQRRYLLSLDVSSKESKLKRYRDLVTQLEDYRLLYEDYSNLKFALSGTTGIPLEHIRAYFKKVTKIANELLDIVYHGDLYLDKFEITENDFLMPYVKNGVRIDDVSSASQGEASFFNMAISSALRAMSMSRYNVGLYDEVDSMFDDKNRQRFIPVLEKQMELNNIRQAFLITHNMMFRQYPVDIINMEDLDKSTIGVKYE